MKIKHYLTIATLFFLAAMNLSAKSEHKTVNDLSFARLCTKKSQPAA